MKGLHTLKATCVLCAAMLLALASGAQTVSKISAGGWHSLFLTSDGSLWAMGDETYGQLGDDISRTNAQIGVNLPEQILAGNVTAISGGLVHTLFLKRNGSLWAVGSDGSGQLGDGISITSTQIRTNIPEQIVASGVTAIAAGWASSLFLKSDGSLWAMGDNQYGELGDGTYTSTNKPEQIVASNVTAIATGWGGTQPVSQERR